jgi:hypothetical protein
MPLPTDEAKFARFLHSLTNLDAEFHLDDDPTEIVRLDQLDGEYVPSFTPEQSAYLKAAMDVAYSHDVDVWAVADREKWPDCIQPDDDDTGVEEMPANMPESVSRLVSE